MCRNEHLTRVEWNKYDRQTYSHVDRVHPALNLPQTTSMPGRHPSQTSTVRIAPPASAAGRRMRTPHKHHVTTMKQLGRVVLVRTTANTQLFEWTATMCEHLRPSPSQAALIFLKRLEETALHTMTHRLLRISEKSVPRRSYRLLMKHTPLESWCEHLGFGEACLESQETHPSYSKPRNHESVK